MSSIPASTALSLPQPPARMTWEEPQSLAPGKRERELGRGYKQAPSRTPFLRNSRKPCQWGFTPAQPHWAQPSSVNVARQLLEPVGQMQIGYHPRIPAGKYLPAEAPAPSGWKNSRALQLRVGVIEKGKQPRRLHLPTWASTIPHALSLAGLERTCQPQSEGGYGSAAW